MALSTNPIKKLLLSHSTLPHFHSTPVTDESRVLTPILDSGGTHCLVPLSWLVSEEASSSRRIYLKVATHTGYSCHKWCWWWRWYNRWSLSSHLSSNRHCHWGTPPLTSSSSLFIDHLLGPGYEYCLQTLPEIELGNEMLQTHTLRFQRPIVSVWDASCTVVLLVLVNMLAGQGFLLFLYPTCGSEMQVSS